MKKKNKFTFGKLTKVLSAQELEKVKGGNKPNDKFELYHLRFMSTGACPPPFEEDKP